jgi:hypothetical protein
VCGIFIGYDFWLVGFDPVFVVQAGVKPPDVQLICPVATISVAHAVANEIGQGPALPA